MWACLQTLLLLVVAASSALPSNELIRSFNGPFQLLLQFQGDVKGWHLANALPGSANEGLIIGLNGSQNPGNLAQMFQLKNGTFSTSYGAVTYGNRTTAPDATGYPLAYLTTFQDYFYLQFVPSGNNATYASGIAFQKSSEYPGYYELVGNGTSPSLGFGKLFNFDARVEGVFSAVGGGKHKAVKILTGGP